MQAVGDDTRAPGGQRVVSAEAVEPTSNKITPTKLQVVRRNGSVVGFEDRKIAVAITQAFLAVSGGQGAASAKVREVVEAMTKNVVSALGRRNPTGGTVHIEDIQDQVELALMRQGEHEVARAYVVYREDRNRERARHSRSYGSRKRKEHSAGCNCSSRSG